MELDRKIVMMSHLSDVQELVNFHGKEEEIRERCNFVKVLINDPRDHISEDELNKIWRETQEKYN